jgi:hypothetical protein
MILCTLVCLLQLVQYMHSITLLTYYDAYLKIAAILKVVRYSVFFYNGRVKAEVCRK